MIRKLLLVGMLVMAGRGSVAQLFLAIVISFIRCARLDQFTQHHKHKRID